MWHDWQYGKCGLSSMADQEKKSKDLEFERASNHTECMFNKAKNVYTWVTAELRD